MRGEEGGLATLVFGAFGEASAAVEQLIDALAEAGVDVHWRAMKAMKAK